MSHDHNHDHDDDHTAPPSEMELRVKALETLLVEKGIVNADAIDELIQTYEFRIGPKNGAKVVARAWVDPEYKKRLLENSTAAIAELGFSGVQGEDMTVVENTALVHNVTVCTLCSCYPWPTLGLPPTWYKSAAYRSRVVLEPRAVLKEFGLDVSEQKEVRVWDSNADLRYLVLPERPLGTDNWTEDQLIDLVTRDSMIGVGVALAPSL